VEYFVYILKSKKDGTLYTGFTSNLQERLIRHNSSKVIATRRKVPFEIVYFEKCLSLTDALVRERYFKSSKASKLKKSLRGTG
jgi:putative endonuclease